MVKPSRYTIRITPPVNGNGANVYHEVCKLAEEVASSHPGLTVEVVEDKVWMSVSTVHRRDDGA